MKRKKHESIKTISSSILKLLALGSAVTIVGLISQGRSADRLVKGFGKFAVWEIRDLIRRLQIQKLIVYDEEDEHSPITLTEKGFLRVSKENLKKIKGKKWDHFWRVVLFDIPERKGRTRRTFQRMLRSLGFYKIQKSVYAYPFDCRSDILRLSANYGISSFVTVLTIPNLANHERKARDHYFQRVK